VLLSSLASLFSNNINAQLNHPQWKVLEGNCISRGRSYARGRGAGCVMCSGLKKFVLGLRSKMIDNLSHEYDAVSCSTAVMPSSPIVCIEVEKSK
jgi:hypothetical protein